MRSGANWPGISAPSALSNTARTRTVPLLASTWLSTSCRWPSIRRVACRRRCPSAPGSSRSARARWRRAGRSLQRARDDLLVGVEARVDRAHRHQRGQHRRAGAGGDQVADGDLELADAARRPARAPACSRGSGARSAAAACAARRLASASRCALRRSSYSRCAMACSSQQALGALVARSARWSSARLRGGDLGFGAVDLGRVRRRVDGDQQVALPSPARLRGSAPPARCRRRASGCPRARPLRAGPRTRPRWRRRSARRWRPTPASPGGAATAWRRPAPDCSMKTAASDGGDGRQRGAGDPEAAAGLERNLVHGNS